MTSQYAVKLMDEFFGAQWWSWTIRRKLGESSDECIILSYRCSVSKRMGEDGAESG